jgi:hypothetical protein
MHTHIKIVGICAIIVVAAVAGFVATSHLQRVVPIVPGVQGCWRLQGISAQTDCLSEQFVDGARESAADKTGAERDQAVIAYVRRADKLAASDPQLGGVCHPAMHVLGRDEGVRAAHADRFPTFPDGGTSRLCTAGYVHGLAEGYLQDTPHANVARVFPNLCQQANARSGCAHGVGHALLRAHSGDAWKTAALDAVSRCDTLPGAYHGNCHDGVYMELAMRTQPDRVSTSEYAQQCRAADDQDAVLGLACWGYLGLSLTTNEVPLADTPAWCAKASGSGQFTCIEGYGRDLGVRKVASCENAALRTALVQRCIEGAIGLQVGSSHISKAQALHACQSLDATANASYCTGAVKRYVAGRSAVAAGDGSAPAPHDENDTSVM